MADREQGRVKNFFEEKGFGFLRRENGEDLFAHVSAFGFIVPKAGDRVSFAVGTNPRNGKIEAKAIAILSE